MKSWIILLGWLARSPNCHMGLNLLHNRFDKLPQFVGSNANVANTKGTVGGHVNCMN